MIVTRGRRRKLVMTIVALLAVPLVAYLDFATGEELAFSVFYLLPVLAAAYYGHRGYSFATAGFASAAWLLAERAEGVEFSTMLVPVWNLVIRFGTLGIVAYLLWSLRRQLALATHRERTDALTGLVARGRFLQLLQGEAQRARRYGHPISIAYIDVDDFKKVNDAGGHAEGDRLLRAIASALYEGTRDVDVAGRMGGDEFMLLMPETAADEARVSAERVHAALTHTVRAHGFGVTFSIGVLTFVTPPDGIDAAVHEVDALMYEVKREGKNGFLHRIAATDDAPASG